MSPKRWHVVPRRHDLHALALSFALITTLVSCGAQDPPVSRVSDLTGAGGESPGGVPTGLGGEASSAGGETSAGASSSMAGASSGGGTTTPSSAPACPTYDGDLLPNVFMPVCSTCHNSQSQVPNWGVYSSAKASCAAIGSRVASGAMPPSRSGLSLSAEQKSLVADWVRLGCPRTKADLPATCLAPPSPAGTGGAPSSNGAGGAGGTSPPSTGAGGAGGTATSAAGAGGVSTTPPVLGTVTITRAEWDGSKQTLRLEGTSSDVRATLTAEFDGRSVMVANDGGRFRVELTGVTMAPDTVTVRSSTGAVASANVQAN